MASRHSSVSLLLSILLIGVVGCDSGAPMLDSPVMEREFAETLISPAQRFAALARDMPDLPEPQNILGGGRRSTVKVKMPNGNFMTMWIYQPEVMKSGKVPCVFIAPAGTMMVHGKVLAAGDEPEHLPWAKAGFAVVAYELSGDADPKSSSDASLRLAATQFREAKGGLMNAQVAMAYAKEKLDFVDARKFYTVGHSSAGTIALYVAMMDSQVKGCVAFAPAIDIRTELGPNGMSYLQQKNILDDAGSYINSISPSTFADRLTVPTFLFFARDDNNVNVKDVEALARHLRGLDRDVTEVAVLHGGHYDSMIDEGIPLATEWLQMVNATH